MRMEIKILGPGCPKCKVTESQVRRAVEQLGLIVQITKVEDLKEIMSYNILSTPALLINGKVKSVGRVPSLEDIKRFIKEEENQV